MLASVRHRRLQVTKLRPAVVAGPLEAVREHAILREQRADRVGELNFVPGSGPGLRQVMKNARCQDVPPDHGKVRRSCFRSGLLDDSQDAIEAHCHGLGLDDAVLEALLWRDLLHGNHRRLVALEYLRHLPQDRRSAVDQVIGQDHGKHLVVDRGLSAQHRVPQPERLGLPDVNAVDRFGDDFLDQLQQLALPARGELRLDLVGLVEVILDGALVSPRNEHHVANSRRHGFLDGVLNERLVDNRHHFLWARLGRREETAAHAGHGEDGFRYFSQDLDSSNILRRPASSSTATPSLRAFSSLPPASSPATT